MSARTSDYVEPLPNGAYRIAGTRVSLDSVIHAYWDGQQPESIVANFPSLSLEKVYGAIAYYLRNREVIDRYFQSQDQAWAELKQKSELQHGPLFNRIRQSRLTVVGQGEE